MATVVRENIGLLNDKLTVKVSKEDYFPAFEKKLKEYSKTANIPGFRKGMVPAGMIKKMYGSGIYSDEILKVVETQLYAYLNEEKPAIFAQPLPLDTDMSRIDMNDPQEYSFDFEIGLKPAFEMPDISKAKLVSHTVEVTDDMLNEEIERIQVKGGKPVAEDAVSSEENVLTVHLIEVNEAGELVESGVSKEITLVLKAFTASAQKELMGKKAGDNLILPLNQLLEAGKIHEVSEDLGADSADKTFKVELVKIETIGKRNMNEAFFNEVFPGRNVSTEDDFRTALKSEIQQYWDAQSRNQLHDQLYHFLLEETKMDFPEKFLTRWLETGGDKPKTPEQATAEFPGFSGQLKWTLISDRLISENKLEVTEAELKESMRNEVSRYFGQMNMGEDLSWLDSYIDRMMKDEKQVDATYRRLVTEKLFTFLESQANPAVEKVTPEALTAMQHNHQH